MTKLLDTCKLIPPEARKHGNCQWCGERLPRTKAGKIHKSRRWCGRTCSKAYLQNHFWTQARLAALVRDGHRCQSCSKGPSDLPRPTFEGFSSGAKYRAALAKWELDVKSLRLEVHHIRPIKGRGYSQSCLHHQANLRTLCHKCHKAVHSH